MPWWNPIDWRRGGFQPTPGPRLWDLLAPPPAAPISPVAALPEFEQLQPNFPTNDAGLANVAPLGGLLTFNWWKFHSDPRGGAHVIEPLDRLYHLQAQEGVGSRLMLNRPTLPGSAEDPAGKRRPPSRAFRARHRFVFGGE